MNRKIFEAIRRAVRVGLMLKYDHPEIEGMFLDGNNSRHINVVLNIASEYEVTPRIGNNAIRFCLKGHYGDNKTDSYSGLLALQDYRAECIRQRKILSKKCGKYTLETKTGIFALNEEDKIRIRSSGGKRVKELGKGIHCLSPEQRRINGSRAGYLSAIKRGYIPWEIEHEELVLNLVREGKSNAEIANLVNITYFESKPVRNTASVYNLRRNTLEKITT